MYKKRAVRRFQNRIKLKAAVSLVRLRWAFGVYPYDSRTRDELYEGAARIRDHMKDCSCAMCCNPRHSKWLSNTDRLTLQERRNLDRFKEWKKSKPQPF